MSDGEDDEVFAPRRGTNPGRVILDDEEEEEALQEHVDAILGIDDDDDDDDDEVEIAEEVVVSEAAAAAAAAREKAAMDAEDRKVAMEEDKVERHANAALDQVKFMRRAQLLAENLGHEVAAKFIDDPNVYKPVAVAAAAGAAAAGVAGLPPPHLRVLKTEWKRALIRATEVEDGKKPRHSKLKSAAWEWKKVVTRAKAKANTMAGTKTETEVFKNAEFIRAALGSAQARRYARAINLNPNRADAIMDAAFDRYYEEGIVGLVDDGDKNDPAHLMAKQKMWAKVARHFDDIDKSRSGEEVTSDALRALRIQVQRPVRQYFSGAITYGQFKDAMDRYRDQYLDVLAGHAAFGDEDDDEYYD